MIKKIIILLKKYREVLLYLVFGGLTTLVNIVVFYITDKSLSINWKISNIISWIASVVFAYFTNRKFVFESRNKDILREIVSFFGFRLFSLFIDMACMYLFIDKMHIDSAIAKLFVQIIVVVLNYIFSKLFIFEDSKILIKKMKSMYAYAVEKLKKITNKQWFFMIMFVSFIMIFILNHFTPLIADDYTYSFGLKGKRIQNFMDILQFQKYHYLNWGGRSVVHTIAQTFLLFNKNVFNFLNSIVYSLFTFLVYKHAVGNTKEWKPSLYLLIHIILWISLPVFGQNILWLIGSCNYLWGITISLLFLLPFRLKLEEENNSSILFAIFMFCFGIIAGWTNENNSAAILSIIFLFAAYRLFRKKKLLSWHISGFIGNLIGFVVMIAAPGNFIRSKEFVSGDGPIMTIIKRFFGYTDGFIDYVLPLFILFIILSFLAYHFGKNKKEKIWQDIIYVVGSFAAIYSMLLSPTFPPRSWMGPIVLMLIALLSAYHKLDLNHEVLNLMNKIIVISLVILVCFSYLRAYKDIRKVYNGWNDRVNYIQEEKERGNDTIEVLKLYPINRHTASYDLVDLSLDTTTWPNPSVASFFKIKTIKGYEYTGK